MQNLFVRNNVKDSDKKHTIHNYRLSLCGEGYLSIYLSIYVDLNWHKDKECKNNEVEKTSGNM